MAPIQPLIDTRARAIVRRGSPPLTRGMGRHRSSGATLSFRTRLFLGILIAVLLPLGALAFGVRREMERRLTAEYEGRVGSMAGVIEADLAREGATVASRLTALAADLSRNNRFRLAVAAGGPVFPAIPARLRRRRHAALRSVDAPDPGQRRQNSQFGTFPE